VTKRQEMLSHKTSSLWVEFIWTIKAAQKKMV
jgi:hypothetical protein